LLREYEGPNPEGFGPFSAHSECGIKPRNSTQWFSTDLRFILRACAEEWGAAGLNENGQFPIALGEQARSVCNVCQMDY
jgi:hypothetical protein